MKLFFNKHWPTTVHKYYVFKYALKVCWALIKRAWVHDLSKYSKEEAPYFLKAKKLSTITYGTEEYNEILETCLKPALDHHYKNNTHHPEHYSNGISDMTLLDEIEMLIDWKAATLRHNDGNIIESLHINQERFKYNNKKYKKYLQFYHEINSINEYNSKRHMEQLVNE